MTELNIVDLIEKNPISRLSATYNNKLLLNIQKTFTGFEQKLFVSSFYCYLNYDKNLDFVVDLDNIWIWLGFASKFNAIRTLELHFQVGVDYKKTIPQIGGIFSEQESATKAKQNGGQNRQIIMLTIKCFKSLCLKAQTKKAAEIHEYYMKMEEVLHKIVEEETDELRKQLEQKDTVIAKTIKEKARAVEQATIAQFPLNTECIYFGTIDNTNEEKETMIKFGHTNDLATRVQNHHKIYDNFVLTAAFRVQNKVEIENLIKAHPKIKRHMRHIEVKGTTKTEIIAYDANLTIERLTKHIKDIIHSKTYSIDNFNRMLKQNDELEAEKRALQEQLEKLKIDLEKKEVEIQELRETVETQQASISVAVADNQSVYQNASLPEDEQTKKFSEFVDAMCIVRPDVEESSVNMEGQFRIWSHTKPKKETFHALKNYLDTRFKPSRLTIQTKNQVVHGYIGVKLKELVYKKKHSNHPTETFLFQVCAFSPCGKILNSTLLTEYQRWKKTVDLPTSDTDLKDLKDYLNDCEYAVKATVWTDRGSNEGYYGLSLRSDEPRHKATSATGKKVEKRTVKENFLITTWETIAKAAEAEKFSPAKMSRSIKNKVTFNDEYYYCASEK
uniref:MSV199 domain-containing protein n=1 Tax=viral metagenome TaxID=1070528 RepID=A0A6C0DN55_9ZZZZ